MRYCGRDFSDSEIEGIRQLIKDHPKAKRALLSRLVCEQIGWLRDDGRLKDMSCRVAMLRMCIPTDPDHPFRSKPTTSKRRCR